LDALGEIPVPDVPVAADNDLEDKLGGVGIPYTQAEATYDLRA